MVDDSTSFEVIRKNSDLTPGPVKQPDIYISKATIKYIKSFSFQNFQNFPGSFRLCVQNPWEFRFLMVKVLLFYFYFIFNTFWEVNIQADNKWCLNCSNACLVFVGVSGAHTPEDQDQWRALIWATLKKSPRNLRPHGWHRTAWQELYRILKS